MEHFLTEHRQIANRVFVVKVPALAHHQQVTEAAHVIVELLDLRVDRVGCAGEGYARVNILINRAGQHLDPTAIA